MRMGDEEINTINKSILPIQEFVRERWLSGCNCSENNDVKSSSIFHGRENPRHG